MSIISMMAVIFAVLFSISVASAQSGPKDGAGLTATDLERVKAGDKAPDFTLEDMAGNRISLSDFRGKKNVVLVFYRGHWWPYCAAQLGKLKSLLNEEEKKKVQILAVSIDSHENSKKLVQKLKEGFPGEFDFPLLEDKNHKVIDRYGILNPDGQGWPHPATYVIDKQGVVRQRFVEVDYRKRPSNEQILQALRAIP